jgi:hypothetical protein
MEMIYGMALMMTVRAMTTVLPAMTRRLVLSQSLVGRSRLVLPCLLLSIASSPEHLSRRVGTRGQDRPLDRMRGQAGTN